MTYQAALELRLCEPRADLETGMTIRQYLCDLLGKLWADPGRFDGKRPWGDSGWEFDLYDPLAKAGFVDLGPRDDQGELYCWTDAQLHKAHDYVHELIQAVFFVNETRQD